jgi:DNA-binding transcriptional regulator YdaS (Cro superfamily)
MARLFSRARYPEVTARAIDLAGGPRHIAEELGISTAALSGWLHARGRIPIERVSDMERLSGIPREQLRPDVYGTDHDD